MPIANADPVTLMVRVFAFSVRFPARPADQQLFHFCYEADRGSMPLVDMLKKFRAYYHYVKRQQKHKEVFASIQSAPCS